MASIKIGTGIALLTLAFSCAAWAQGAPAYRPAPPFAAGIAPEDIVTLPGTKWLIAGAGVGSTANDRGGLSVIDTANPTIMHQIYPGAGSSVDFDKTRYKNCPGPLSQGFAPHGINVERLPDGSTNLIVVNHRGRESLEIFHIDTGSAIPRAVWRGCIELPAPASGNSVAPLPAGGGYIVTNFYRKNDPDYLREMENGTATGNLLKWTPENGWSDLRPENFSGANGAEVTPDGKWLFVTEWSDYKVWKFPLQGDAPPKAIHLDFLPDNLRLTARGTLLIAGQNADPINVMTCRRTHDPCQPRFTVLEMNPDTMATHVLAQGGDMAFGGATGAALTGTSLWISSYFSPNVARYKPAP